jgi:hypothetical protein
MEQNQQAPPQAYVPGIGLDIGTSFLQVARERADGKVEFLAERDAFYAIKPTSTIAAKFIEKSLTQRGAFVLKSGGIFFVVGKQAIETAIERGDSVERPLKRGVVSARDKESMPMLAVLIKALVKNSMVPDEICVYSYPANPIEGTFDVVYHQNRMAEILSSLGYRAVPLLEAEALAYSELMAEDLTGIAISCGAGMHNLAVFHIGECLFSFSIAEGGDYIDRSAATSLGISDTEVQAEKENNLNLLAPVGEIQETVVMYYRNLVNHVISLLEKKFKNMSDLPHFRKPITIVVSGGTSLPVGYMDLFRDFLRAEYDVRTKELKKIRDRSFPFEIGEVKQAKDPLTAVANGCLIYSQVVGSEE